MSREVAVLLIAAVALGVLLLMLLGWRRRARRDAGLRMPLGVPEHAEVLSRYQVLYVATTRHDSPLDRVAIRPLAFRARGEAAVTDRGLALCMDGSATVFLPRATLRHADRATWTIDRVVEPGGLVRLEWEHESGAALDSYFRVVTGDAATFISDLERLIASSETGVSS